MLVGEALQMLQTRSHLKGEEVYPRPPDATVVCLRCHNCKGHPHHLGHPTANVHTLRSSTCDSRESPQDFTPVKAFVRTATRPAPSGLGTNPRRPSFHHHDHNSHTCTCFVVAIQPTSHTSDPLRRTRLGGNRSLPGPWVPRDSTSRCSTIYFLAFAWPCQ